MNKSPFLNEDNDFFKSTTLDERGFLLKSRQHKYIKRTGAKGKYKYWYRDANGKLVEGNKSGPEKESNKKETGHDIAEIVAKEDIEMGHEMYNALTGHSKLKDVGTADRRGLVEDGLMHPDGRTTDKGREFAEAWRFKFDIGKDGTTADTRKFADKKDPNKGLKDEIESVKKEMDDLSSLVEDIREKNPTPGTKMHAWGKEIMAEYKKAETKFNDLHKKLRETLAKEKNESGKSPAGTESEQVSKMKERIDNLKADNEEIQKNIVELSKKGVGLTDPKMKEYSREYRHNANMINTTENVLKKVQGKNVEKNKEEAKRDLDKLKGDEKKPKGPSSSFLESDNKEHGFFGNLSGHLKIPAKDMEDIFDKVGKKMVDRFDAPEEVIVEFLDSTAGRHFADAVADYFYSYDPEGKVQRPKNSKLFFTIERILDKRKDFDGVINRLKKEFYGKKA